VNATSIEPCGVCAVSVSLNARPSTVPLMGASPIWLPNVPETLPPSSVKVAFAGNSPPGVMNVTSHLPASPPPLVVVAGAVVDEDEVVVLAAAVVSVRFAVQSPSAMPPKFALPVIDAPSTLPVIAISSGCPWNGIEKVNFSSSATSDPVNGSSPAGDLKRPSTFWPSCLNVTFTVFAPCGELIVMSQSPAIVVCANAGAATSRTSAGTANLKRFIACSSERVMKILLYAGVAGAPCRQRALTHVA